MKKLLVLLTVLAMAGTASAAMTIVAPASVVGGETFSIGINVAGGESALITDILAVAGNAAGVDATGVALASDKVTPYFEDLSADVDFQAFMGDLGITGTKGIYYYEFVDVAVPPATLTDGSLIANIMVTAGANGSDIVIALADGANGVLRSQAVVQVIPEPMTIALLGLGGLFLRRRK